MIDHGKTEALSGVSFIDLFAGVGGFRFALESFGAKCTFSSEWDKQAASTYEANHGEKPVGDITKVNEEDIPKMDIICGGFPCQAFSISGSQKGFADVRGTLFFDIVRIAKLHMPKMIFLENVKNLVAHDSGRTFETIKKNLEDLGFHVYSKVMCASDYGIPHARERIFILAFRADLDIRSFNFPAKTSADIVLEDILLPRIQTRQYEIDISSMSPVISEDSVQRALYPIRIGKINLGRQGERIYHPKGHAITLSSGGGGIGAKTGMYLVGNKVRRLAPQECVKLMGLPKTFKLHASENQCYKQFGNGVVVDVLQHILLSVIDQVKERI